MAKGLSAGYHTFALRGFTTETYSMMIAWGFTLEAFYNLPTSKADPPDVPDDPQDPSPPE